MIYFQWDSYKAAKNLSKHGVSFAEAATVFFDPRIMLTEDSRHSQTEDRFIALGETNRKRVVFVAFTYRRSKGYEKEIYRIISARLANKNERKTYG